MSSVCFSPVKIQGYKQHPTSPKENDQILASSGQDETIKLWDLQIGECLKTLRPPRPNEGMNITDVRGLTEVTVTTLKALGAVEV